MTNAANGASERLRTALVDARTTDFLTKAVPPTMARHLTPARLASLVLGAASRTPKLLECTPSSIVKCVAYFATMGLEPGDGPLAEGYLVPFRNRRQGISEAQPIVGYRGLMALGRRAGVESIAAHIVYENDEFALDLLHPDNSKHTPALRGERGKPIGA